MSKQKNAETGSMHVLSRVCWAEVIRSASRDDITMLWLRIDQWILGMDDGSGSSWRQDDKREPRATLLLPLKYLCMSAWLRRKMLMTVPKSLIEPKADLEASWFSQIKMVSIWSLTSILETRHSNKVGILEVRTNPCTSLHLHTPLSSSCKINRPGYRGLGESKERSGCPWSYPIQIFHKTIKSNK